MIVAPDYDSVKKDLNTCKMYLGEINKRKDYTFTLLAKSPTHRLEW